MRIMKLYRDYSLKKYQYRHKFKNVITNGYSHVKAEIVDTVRKNKPEDRPTWAILLVIIMREISKALIPIAITTTLATSWNAENGRE